MKSTVRLLHEKYSSDELRVLLIKLRKEKQKSFREISDYFKSENINGSDSLYRRLFNKLQIEPITRRRNGPNNPFYGKKHTDIIKKKISETRKQSGLSRGNKNPFFW